MMCCYVVRKSDMLFDEESTKCLYILKLKKDEEKHNQGMLVAAF